MALVISGPLVIASSSQQPQVETFGNLKECVARTFNAENQPKRLEDAGKMVQRAVDWVNLSYRLNCGSKQTSDTAIVAGTNTIALASDFWAVQQVQLIDSAGKPARTLRYIPFEQLNSVEPDQDDTGAPLWWTNRNSFDDNTIEVYPVPDAGAASNYTTRLTYFERLNKPSADSDIIDAPREMGLVLCTYAEHLMGQKIDRQNVAFWASKKREAEKLLGLFINAEQDQNENMQFRVDWSANYSSPGDPLA